MTAAPILPDGLQDYVAERDAALLSLDRTTIEAFCRDYGLPISPQEDIFWATVHKARTAAKTMPMAARSLSKRWLLDRGLTAWDDGDVP